MLENYASEPIKGENGSSKGLVTSADVTIDWVKGRYFCLTFTVDSEQPCVYVGCPPWTLSIHASAT